MGSIYKQKNSKNFWVKDYRSGRVFRESSGSPKESVAKRLLRLREGDIERGVPITPRVGRLRFDEAAIDLVTDYKVNGKRSLAVVERRIRKHLEPFFGGRRMAAVTTADVRTYIDRRQSTPIELKPLHWGDPPRLRPVSSAEINRELTLLKRMFSLAIQAGKLLHKPHIPMLQEHNVRRGFFEKHQFDDVVELLPAPLRAVVTFAYITGWRIPSEVLTLQWRNVDFGAGEVRLDPGTTKNSEGRVFPMTVELRALLETQWHVTKALGQTNNRIYPWVFQRDGEPIRSLRKAWTTACRKAGCPGRIPHDLRRTAVHNLVRAAIPERVAMQMTGHKTRSVFERYNIVSDGDLKAAAQRLDDAVGIVARQTGTVSDSEHAKLLKRMEAPPGFEPGMEVLQTSALPLGDGAVRTEVRVIRGEKTGAGNGIRTRDFDLGKVALYH